MLWISVIPVVFVTQSIIIQSTGVSAKILPAELTAALNRIRNHEHRISFEEFKANTLIFDYFLKSTAAVIDNNGDVPNIDDTFSGALQSISAAIEDSLAAIDTAAGTSCAAFVTDDDTLYDNLEEALLAIRSAIEEAETGNYPANKAEIYAKGEITKQKLAPTDLFDAIRACLNPNSNNFVETVIRIAEVRANTALEERIDAIIDAIKVYAAMVSDKYSYGDQALVIIDSFRILAFRSIQIEFSSYFACIESIYIYAYYDYIVKISDMYLIRYNLRLTLYRMREAIYIIFAAGAAALEEISSVSETDRSYYYPLANATAESATLLTQYGTTPLYEAIRKTQPTSVPKVVAALAISPGPSLFTVISFFTSLAAATDLCLTSEVVITAINLAQVVASRVVFVSTIAVITGNDVTTLVQQAPVAAEALEIAMNSVSNIINSVHAANKLVGRTYCSLFPASTVDYEAFRAFQKAALNFQIQLVDSVYDLNLSEVVASARNAQ